MKQCNFLTLRMSTTKYKLLMKLFYVCLSFYSSTIWSWPVGRYFCCSLKCRWLEVPKYWYEHTDWNLLLKHLGIDHTFNNISLLLWCLVRLCVKQFFYTIFRSYFLSILIDKLFIVQISFGSSKYLFALGQ